MNDDAFDVVRAGSSLVNSKTGAWLTTKDCRGPAIIFIHGFTSHGRYMARLVDHVQAHDFLAAVFNYDSYRGIDRAAIDLRSRLASVTAPLKHYGYALVAHSMGGLVALQHALDRAGPAGEALKGIVLLGTPTAGALRGRKVVSYMLDWADGLTGPNPYARSPACRSAQQLTGSDDEKFLDSLARRLKTTSLPSPFLSISGGMNFLEYGKGWLAGTAHNLALQRLIKEVPNDGLVPETSADLSRAHGLTNGQHYNDYDDYPRINHTFLTSNQQIADKIVDWLSTEAFPGWSSSPVEV